MGSNIFVDENIGFYMVFAIILLLCTVAIAYTIYAKSMSMITKALACTALMGISAFAGYLTLGIEPWQDSPRQAAMAIQGKESYFSLIKTIKVDNENVHFLRAKSGDIYVYYLNSVYMLDRLRSSLGEERAAAIRKQMYK